MAWTLCSRETAASLHSIDPTILRDEWSDMVEQMIELFLGEELVSVVTYTGELYSGDGTSSLILRHSPITAVSSLSVDGSSYGASDFHIQRNSIVLLNGAVFPRGTLNISVTYSVGGSTNYNIQLTAAAMLAAIANHHGRQGADVSVRWATIPEEMGESSPNQEIGLVSHLYQIMRQNLRRNRLRMR